MSDDARLPPSYESRLTALESRVLALEARLGTAAPPASGSGAPDDGEAWLTQVQELALGGDRAGAIAVYLQNMGGSDEGEAASFVDDLIAKPTSSA